jgi:hypothetical protein
MTLEKLKRSPGGHLLRLSPLTAYYIRKLLYQHAGELRFIVAEGAGQKANYLADLNAVLESLYLEEPEIEAAVKRLEILVYYHQTFSAYTALHKAEVEKAEKEIFWILGFKMQPTK